MQTWGLITQLTGGSILQSFQRAAQRVTMVEGWQKPEDRRVDDEIPQLKNSVLVGFGRPAVLGPWQLKLP